MGSLVGYVPWGSKELDTTEQLTPYGGHRSASRSPFKQGLWEALQLKFHQVYLSFATEDMLCTERPRLWHQDTGVSAQSGTSQIHYTFCRLTYTVV